MRRILEGATLGLALLAGAALSVGACKREAPSGAPASVEGAPVASVAPSPADAEHAPPGPWFKGKPDEAFARARAEGRQVFLYWGAAWCPPCNELKAEIFSKPRFAELMEGFVPVYLDGDSEEAQRLGDTLGVAAYPTMLILSPEREELSRVNGSIDMRELEEALGTVRGKSQGFEAALKRLGEGDLEAEDARLLALTAWELLPEKTWTAARIFDVLGRAVEKCPPALRRERAILAGNLLGIAATKRDDVALKGTIAEIERGAPRMLEMIFADDDAIWASRSFLNYRASDVLGWLHREPKGPAYAHLKERWLKAAAVIHAHETRVSAEAWLWSMSPAIDFFRHEHPRGPVPAELRAEIEAAVKRADESARSPYERHAVISSAAFLLRRVGANDEARRMLIAESERTDTPWYYHSSLSALEQELGRTDEAKAWSAKARETAKGSATRLQWIANDVLLSAKLAGKDQRSYLLTLAEEFYALATSISDGFSGRNRGRAEQVQKALLGALKDDPELARLSARLAGKCEGLADEAKQSCRKHFEELR